MTSAKAILGGLTLKELVLKTWSAIGKHNCLGKAAELAFYFTLALFPLLIVLLNLICCATVTAGILFTRQ